jgi:integrase
MRPAKQTYSGLGSLRHFLASWCVNRKADGGPELISRLSYFHVYRLFGQALSRRPIDVLGGLRPKPRRWEPGA